MTNNCQYIRPWVGPCNAPDCQEHSNLICKSCGAKATHGCDMADSLVCGVPLCDECDHCMWGYKVISKLHDKKETLAKNQKADKEAFSKRYEQLEPVCDGKCSEKITKLEAEISRL